MPLVVNDPGFIILVLVGWTWGTDKETLGLEIVFKGLEEVKFELG
jgi:hypothetical protein